MKRDAKDWEKLLGRQLKRTRLDLNLTQAEVASRCGLAPLTVAKLEAGDGSRLSTLINVMKVLGLEGQLGTLIPETPISPIQVMKQGKQRQRASGKR